MAFFTRFFKKKSAQISMADAKRLAEVQIEAIEELHQKTTKDPLLSRTKIKRLAISKKAKNRIIGSYSNRTAEIVRKTALNKREINDFGNFTRILSRWYLPRKATQIK